LRPLIKILNEFRLLLLLLILALNTIFSNVFAEDSLLDLKESSVGVLHSFNNEELSIYSIVIKKKIAQKSFSNDSIQIFRWKAIDYAQKADVKNATLFIEKYIKSSLFKRFVKSYLIIKANLISNIYNIHIFMSIVFNYC